MRKKVITASIAGIALLMMLVFTGCTQAANTAGGAGKSGSKLQEVLDRGYVIVGTGSTNVPWHFFDDSGELAGFDIEMGKILALALFDDATKVKFVEQSSDNRIPNIVAGNVDICFQFMTITPQRAQQAAFTVPYYTEGIGLMLSAKGKYKTGSTLKAATKSGKEVKVAILQNSYAQKIVDTLLPGAKAEQYEDQGLLYQALEAGRADAAAIDLSSVMWLASKEPQKYIDSEISGYPQNYGAAVPMGDQVWLNFVNTVLVDAMTGANYQLYIDAYAKYFGVQLDPPSIGKPSIYR